MVQVQEDRLGHLSSIDGKRLCGSNRLHSIQMDDEIPLNEGSASILAARPKLMVTCRMTRLMQHSQSTNASDKVSLLLVD